MDHIFYRRIQRILYTQLDFPRMPLIFFVGSFLPLQQLLLDLINPLKLITRHRIDKHLRELLFDNCSGIRLEISSGCESYSSVFDPLVAFADPMLQVLQLQGRRRPHLIS